MKKILLSVIAVAALSNIAFAGKNVAIAEVAPVAVSEGAFYIGAGYSILGGEYTDDYPGALVGGDIDGDAFLLLAGYRFNQYFALEGRYTHMGDVTVNEVNPTDGYNAALYLKAILPAGDFSLYGLVGYGTTDLDNGLIDDSDFQWGLGASYAFTENLSVFADYTLLYDETEAGGMGDITKKLDTINIGAIYTF